MLCLTGLSWANGVAHGLQAMWLSVTTMLSSLRLSAWAGASHFIGFAAVVACVGDRTASIVRTCWPSRLFRMRASHRLVVLGFFKYAERCPNDFCCASSAVGSCSVQRLQLVPQMEVVGT